MKTRNHLYQLYKELILIPKIKQLEEDYSLLKSLETPFNGDFFKLFFFGNKYTDYQDLVTLNKGKELFGDNFLNIYNEQKYLKEVLTDLDNLKNLLIHIDSNDRELKYYVGSFLIELKQLRYKQLKNKK